MQTYRIAVLFLVSHEFIKLGVPFGPVTNTPLETEPVQELLALAGKRSGLANLEIRKLLSLRGNPVT